MPDLPAGSTRTPLSFRVVTEQVRAGRTPLHVHPEWARAFPWVVQGTTVRRPAGAHPIGDRTGRPEPGDLDFGLFTGAPAGATMKRWEYLARDTGCGRVVHARQIHGCEIAVHGASPPGLLLAPPCDGHVTRQPGTLLAVSVADCVPVFVIAPSVGAVMLLHAGWRGVAGGILEAGLMMLQRRFGVLPREARIHMGPAICGRCYEVGREVHEALGLPRPSPPALPVDLRRVLADRSLATGADPAHVTSSSFCTRCADTPFFSHRGGDAGRQIAVLGIAREVRPSADIDRIDGHPGNSS